MATYNVKANDEKSFYVENNGHDSRYSTICSVKVSENFIFVQNRYNGTTVLNAVPYTDISVNGVTFTTVEDCAKALDAVVNFNTGGGSGAVTVADDNFFATAAERDNYFTANPDKKKEGVTVVVNGTLQKWDGTNWIDVSAVVRGEQGIQGEKGDPGIQGIQGVKGDKGDPGIDGIDGQQGIQGIPGENAVSNIQYRGTYDNSVTYVMNDVVVGSDGNAYALTAESQIGIDPPGDNWALFVMKGAPGDQGVPGVQGEKGDNGIDGKTYISAEIPNLDVPTLIFDKNITTVIGNGDVPNADCTWVADEDCFIALYNLIIVTGGSYPLNLWCCLTKNGKQFASDYSWVGGQCSWRFYLEPQRILKGDTIAVCCNTDKSGLSGSNKISLIKYPIISATKEDFTNLDATKQDKLIAGENITIDPETNTISASGELSTTVYTDGETIIGDGTESNPLVAVGSGTQYPTLVQKLYSGISVIYAWKGDTTSTIIAKSSSAGTVSGSYIDSSDSTMYVFSVLPAGISFYLGNDSSENLFYTESVLSIPATMEDLESKQDKLIAGENITIDGNTISASGGSSSNVTYNRSTGELTVDGTQVTVLDLGMGAIKADSITTTSIVEGLGGILAGSFLQNEDGEDYILQKDVEAGYIKKTDLQKEVTFETQDTLYQAGAEVPVVSGEHTHYLVDTTEFIGHVDSDQGRWQTTLDSQVAQEARLKQWCQDLILGSTPVLNYGDPTLVMGNGGLVNLLDGQEWTAPMNGAIVCASGGLLSVAYSVMIDGSSVWESPLYALGIKIGGGESPSDEIPITAGQVVTASGLLSLGSPINVTFYKNKA